MSIDEKYMTLLRVTKRKVKSPATDHDRVIVADARRLLEARVDELDGFLDSVKSLIKGKKALLETEDDALRDLYDSRTVEKHVECDVYVDARGGGTIKLVRKDNGEMFGEPRPLSKEEREVFGATKSQTTFVAVDGDSPVNEDLAKKLKLTEFLSDDPPVDPALRVAAVLERSALPPELRDALLSLDEEDEEPALKKAKKKAAEDDPPKEKKKPGRPKKDAATPTPPADEEPGPATAEKDPEPPKMPVPPPRAAASASDTEDAPTAPPAASDAPWEDDTSEPDESEEDDGLFPDEPAETAPAAETPAEPVTTSEEDDAPVSASDYEPPPASDAAPPSEESDVSPASEAEDDDLPDFSEAATDPESVFPADPQGEDMAPPSEVTPIAPPAEEEPPASDAAPASAVAPVNPEPPVEPLPAPKKKGAKKKEAAPPVTPPAVVAPAPEPPPVAPAPPPAAPALSMGNHFGLGEKIAASFIAGVEKALRITPVFAARAEEIVSAPGCNSGKKINWPATWKNALVPVLEHLAAEKALRRRETSGTVVFWNEKHDATIDAAIAGFAKDGGRAFLQALGA